MGRDESVFSHNDESILSYFEQNYRQLLKLTIMMVKDIGIAQDILHNVAVVLLRRQEDLYDVRNYGAYLGLCIRRSALNYFRSYSRVEAQDPAMMAEMHYSPNSGAAFDYVEWVILLEKYLEKFDPAIRKAFIAHYLDNEPIEGIAQTLGLTTNALTLRFKRMRDALAKSSPEILLHLIILMLL